MIVAWALVQTGAAMSTVHADTVARVLKNCCILQTYAEAPAPQPDVPRLTSHHGRGQPLIHARDLRKTYHVGDQMVQALDGLDLDIHANEYVALMGPSGSGKSTLMNMLGCLDSPTSGKYILNGQDVSRLDDDALADIRNREIGFVFQTFNLLPRYTAVENVALPMIYGGFSKVERDARAREVLTQVGLGDRMDHKPNELSGGQRQRVAVARALVMKPSIILADEPTGNLDTATSLEVMQLFSDIQKAGNTVILVTHEEDIAACAHRTVRLRDGKVESDV